MEKVGKVTLGVEVDDSLKWKLCEKSAYLQVFKIMLKMTAAEEIHRNFSTWKLSCKLLRKSSLTLYSLVATALPSLPYGVNEREHEFTHFKGTKYSAQWVCIKTRGTKPS